MIKTWVDKILDNEHYEVDKNKIIGLINEWIQWLEETKNEAKAKEAADYDLDEAIRAVGGHKINETD